MQSNYQPLLDARGDGLVEPGQELIAGSWMKRGETNWLLNGPRANCTDKNWGNVAVFSEQKFSASESTSILLTFNVSHESLFPTCRIGIVDETYPYAYNADLRTHSDYGFFSKPGNKLLGEVQGSVFNVGVSLTGEVWVCGDKAQLPRVTDYPRGEVRVRVDINAESDEVRISSSAWGNRAAVETISCSRDLRLAVCTPLGCALEIEYISQQPTLVSEARIDLSLDDDELLEQSKVRCNELVEKIRVLTADEPIKLVVVGQFGVGKSSFINTALTAFCNQEEDAGNYPKTSATVSKSSKHCTKFFREYPLKEAHVTLIDTIGVEQMNDGSMNYKDVVNELLMGKLAERFSEEDLKSENLREIFDQNDGSDEKSQAMGLRLDLDVDSMNHGAIVVVVPDQADSGDAGLSDAILKFQTRFENNMFPVIGVVTQLDKGREFSLRKLFTDPDVAFDFNRAVNLVDEKCFPVRCYKNRDKQVNAGWNYLAVEALHAVVIDALEYKRRCRDGC